MSLGLILVAHFAQKSLNMAFVSILLLVYVSFSVNMWFQFSDALAPVLAFRTDLEMLQAVGTTSKGTDTILARGSVRPWDIFTYPA